MTEKEILRRLTFIKHHLNKIIEDNKRCEKYGHTLYLIPIIDTIERAQKTVKNVYKANKHTKSELQQQKSTN